MPNNRNPEVIRLWGVPRGDQSARDNRGLGKPVRRELLVRAHYREGPEAKGEMTLPHPMKDADCRNGARCAELERDQLL